VLLLLAVSCSSLAGDASAHGTTSLREQQLREIHRPMLTSHYLASKDEHLANGDEHLANGAAFGARPSFVGTSQLKRMVKYSLDPEPRPYAVVPPFDIKTTRGAHRVAAGKDASYVFVIYSKDESMQKLWYNSSATAMFRAMPPKSHMVFAATDGKGSEGAVNALRTRMENARGFAEVRDRLHFVEKPITLHCTAQEFPKCSAGQGQSVFHQAVVSWGSIEPSLDVTIDGVVEELDASGATGMYDVCVTCVCVDVCMCM